jgi:hypothetical protein
MATWERGERAYVVRRLQDRLVIELEQVVPGIVFVDVKGVDDPLKELFDGGGRRGRKGFVVAVVDNDYLDRLAAVTVNMMMVIDTRLTMMGVPFPGCFVIFDKQENLFGSAVGELLLANEDNFLDAGMIRDINGFGVPVVFCVEIDLMGVHFLFFKWF